MATVSSNNLTTLYSRDGVSVRPTSAYGNANVVSLLNIGTDGGNTITNIVAAGNMTIGNIVANSNITADNFFGNVANATNANFANYAGNAFSVAVANVVGIGNIATTNYDGNGSNILRGNGFWGPETFNLVANFANYAGNVTVSAQPNITSLGTLVNVSVTGNITSASGLFIGNGGGLANINGANVGVVGNANIANVVRNNAQPNITSVGTLTGITSTGNVDFTGTGNVSLGDVANVHISGGSNTYALTTDGSGNLSWSQTANVNYANFAGQAFAVNGAAVSGYVADAVHSNVANVANSVAVANVVGIGNIAVINLTGSSSNVLYGNGVFAPESTSISNANYANFANVANIANSVSVSNVAGIGNIATLNLDGSNANVLYGNGIFAPTAVGANIANGTSNISIPVANGNINFSVNNNSNIANFDTNGALQLYPTTSSINALRINSFGNPVSGDVSRIASSRARGNLATPLSVNGSDRLMRFLAFGHNGANYQTNSVGTFQAQVDSSYTPNTANIPIGWNMSVNDTNGGVNNQSKVHNFYSNGNVQFANAIFGNSLSVSGTANAGNLTTGGNLTVIGNTNLGSIATGTIVTIAGNNDTGYVQLNGVAFNVIQTNANGLAGYSPFFFSTYQGNTDPIPASKFFRGRGNIGSPTAVFANDQVALNQYAVYADSGNTYKRVFEETITVTGNDGAGNVTANLDIVSFNSNSKINLGTNTHISGTLHTGNINGAGGYYVLGNSSGGNTTVYLFGDATPNSSFAVENAQFSSTLSNVDTTGGFSAFRFQQYTSLSSAVGPWYAYRARGNSFATQLPVIAGDQVYSLQFGVNSNNTYTTVGSFTSTINSNDNAGNVGMALDINAIGAGTTGYNNGRINLYAKTTAADDFTANNISVVSSNGFMQLSTYTVANLTAITGSVGQIATVTNSTPGGMMAYWDTTNTRWSYVHDNSAV